FFEEAAGFFDGGGVVVHRLTAAAQDDVAVGVARGEQDGGLAVARLAEERVRVRGRDDGFNGDLDVAGGAVLETDRAGEARGELAVDLAVGGGRADGAAAE